MNVWTSLPVAAAVALTLITSGAASVVSAQDVLAAREARLAKLVRANDVGETDVEATNAVLATNWTEADLPQVIAALESAIAAQPKDATLHAGSIRFFAETHREAPPALRAYVRSAVAAAELGDEYDLLRAIRGLGVGGAEFQEVVRPKLTDERRVLAIVAASTLCRIDPGDDAALGSLLRFLQSDDSGTLWRAADGAGLAGAADEAIVARLRELQRHEDVRVRTTAATAIWRLTKDVDATLPTLREAMTQADQALALGFIFPSYQGPSHRVYVVEALGEMREAGAPTLDDLVATVEDSALGEADEETVRVEVGLTALSVLASGAPVPEGAVAKLRAATRQEGSVYRNFDQTEIRLKELAAKAIP